MDKTMFDHQRFIELVKEDRFEEALQRLVIDGRASTFEWATISSLAELIANSTDSRRARLLAFFAEVQVAVQRSFETRKAALIAELSRNEDDSKTPEENFIANEKLEQELADVSHALMLAKARELTTLRQAVSIWQQLPRSVVEPQVFHDTLFRLMLRECEAGASPRPFAWRLLQTERRRPRVREAWLLVIFGRHAASYIGYR